MPTATYDTTNKLVKLDQVVPVSDQVSLDVGRDLYSDGKVQWLTDLTLNKFEFPWFAIGGNPLPGGGVFPRAYFLKSGWRIEAYPADHQLNLGVNIFAEDGTALFSPPPGSFTIAEIVTNELTSGDDRIQQIIDILTAESYDQRIRDALALALSAGLEHDVGSIDHQLDRIDRNTLPRNT